MAPTTKHNITDELNLIDLHQTSYPGENAIAVRVSKEYPETLEAFLKPLWSPSAVIPEVNQKIRGKKEGKTEKEKHEILEKITPG